MADSIGKMGHGSTLYFVSRMRRLGEIGREKGLDKVFGSLEVPKRYRAGGMIGGGPPVAPQSNSSPRGRQVILPLGLVLLCPPFFAHPLGTKLNGAGVLFSFLSCPSRNFLRVG